MKFTHQIEKLSQVRRTLMMSCLPSSDRHEILAATFFECYLGLFQNFDESILKYPATTWFETIKKILDVSSIAAEGSNSLYLMKAKSMSEDDVLDYINAVDELCNYLIRNDDSR